MTPKQHNTCGPCTAACLNQGAKAATPNSASADHLAKIFPNRWVRASVGGPVNEADLGWWSMLLKQNPRFKTSDTLFEMISRWKIAGWRV